MISFLIPLRSKASSNNWDITVKLFNNTLKSVFNQIDTGFRVFVACHDLPEIEGRYDDRLQIIQVDYPPPPEVKDQLTDKFYKKRILVNMVQETGGKYIMFVDSDDYISNKLVGWIRKHEHASGWSIENGYEYDVSSNLLRPTPKFNNICGTSAILNISVLVNPIDTAFTNYERENKYLFDFGHNEWNQILTARKEPPLGFLPFRGAIYVLNHGTNWTNDAGQKTGFLRKTFRMIFLGKPITDEIRLEFGIDNINIEPGNQDER